MNRNSAINMGLIHKKGSLSPTWYHFLPLFSFLFECVILVFHRVLKNRGVDSENNGLMISFHSCSLIVYHVSDEQTQFALKYSRMKPG